MVDKNDIATRNSILSGLPAPEWRALETQVEQVELGLREKLYDRGQPLSHAYFILDGFVSLMMEFHDGLDIQVAAVGCEGMLGLPLAFGLRTAEIAAVAHVSTTALRISAGVFATGLENTPVLMRRLFQYAETSRMLALQAAARNAHHNLYARLAHCLLEVQDHIRSDVVPLTHETLASLLCAHRPSISVAIRQMERSELVQATARTLVIVNRMGLEEAARGFMPQRRAMPDPIT